MTGSLANGIDLSAPARAETSPLFRSALREFLAHTPLSLERAGDVVLAVGEATANAIEHAYLGSRGTIRLRAMATEARVIVEVQDSGNWRSGNSADRGRGLGIIRALVDIASIESTSAGTSVRLEVALDPQCKARD
jgi:anti-sigma regulatory factor (Ser/Thr protein kinase)